jgi:3-methyl-2-oxobutanoate hydroxymethyltransferase
VAAAISKRLAIPTIGIGSGAGTDGQVLVLHDLLDMHGADSFQPKFVKRFAHIGDAMRDGVKAYADEVRARTFPGPEHVFAIAPEELSAFTTAVEADSAGDNILADW